jgi:hypothetical protein
MSPRVREAQAVTLADQVAIGDEVEIKGAIGIALVTPHSAVCFLNTQ